MSMEAPTRGELIADLTKAPGDSGCTGKFLDLLGLIPPPPPAWWGRESRVQARAVGGSVVTAPIICAWKPSSEASAVRLQSLDRRTAAWSSCPPKAGAERSHLCG